MPKVCFISDTHNLLDQVELPAADILIHAGDATNHGKPDELALFNQQLGGVRNRYRHIVLVAGNHDWLFERDPTTARSIMTNCIYLQDNEVTIEGLRIYGSPWQPRFYDWAFNLSRGKQLADKWKQIPHGLDLLITHGPPWGVLDITYRNDHAGCQDLLERVQDVRPRWHVFGHIHHSYGIQTGEPTNFVNACTCDESYQATNAPIVVDIPGSESSL